MTKIITIAQQKGGVGKTTIAANIAVALMQRKNNILLIDIDPQNSLTYWYKLREQKLGEYSTGLSFQNIVGWRLNLIFEQVQNKYDYLIIDSPPHAEIDSKAAIRVADFVVVPTQVSPTDVWAIAKTLNFINSEKKIFKTLLNRYNPSSKISKEIITKIPNQLMSYLGNRVAFSSSFICGLGVTEFDKNSQAAFEVNQLADEILSILS